MRHLELLLAAALAVGPGCRADGISGVRVKRNQHNVLACTVRWRTRHPATSEVVFEHPDGSRWRVSSSEPTTEHELLVVGMRPDLDYDLELASETRSGRRWTAHRTFRTGTPPAPVRPREVSAHDREAARAGWTLVDLDAVDQPPTVAMYDMEGQPVWYHQRDTARGGPVDASWTHRGTVLLGGGPPARERPVEIDLAGDTLWSGPEQVGFDRDGYLHHHLELLDSGTYLALEKRFVGGARGDVAFEMTLDGTRLWQWDTWDWLEPSGEEEWTHANWVHRDGKRGWISLAATGQIVAFDLATGEIDFVLGADGDFRLLGTDRWFDFQHAPVLTGPDRILVYDNRGLGQRTRLLELELDAAGRNATVVWEYDGQPDDGWYAWKFGSVDLLDNGNLLVAATTDPDAPRLFELDPEDRVVWRMEMPVEVYRARRIDALAEPVDPR